MVMKPRNAHKRLRVYNIIHHITLYRVSHSLPNPAFL